MSEEQRRAPNCPFYGCHLSVGVALTDHLAKVNLIIMRERSNRCGLALDSITPCERQLTDQPVEWDECRVVHEHLIDLGRR